MDFKDKFKNFLDDSKSKLLSPSSESTAQSIDVILPTQVNKMAQMWVVP